MSTESDATQAPTDATAGVDTTVPAAAPAPESASDLTPASAPAEPTAAPAEPEAPAKEPTTLEEAIQLGLERGGFKAKDAESPPATPSEAPGQTSTIEGQQGATEPVAAAPPEPDLDADIPEPTEVQMKGANPELRKHVKRVHVQNQRLKAQVRESVPAAQQFQKLQAFMAENELDTRSTANALRIAASVQGAINGRVDPSAVLQELEQWTSQLRSLSGDQLPDDVQQSLDEGTIDEDRAKEIARLRAEVVRTNRKVELDTAQLSTQAAGAQAELLKSAVRTWEQAVRQRDPDFQRIAQQIEDRAFKYRMVYGPPANAQQAVARAQHAYDEIRREVRPAQQPSVRSPLNGAPSPKSTVRTAPKTMQEAILQGLERMGH